MSILVATDAPVARITLDRPDALNALTAEMLDDLADALERLGTDPAISVIVLRGAGRAFSAGVDLKALGGRPIPNGAVGDVLDIPARRAIAAMGAADAIVVAAVHGFCFTGALELALGCDVCITTTDAKFGDTHTKFGLRPSWGMSQRLPRAVGLPRARWLTSTARTFSGAEAAAWGLAAEAVPPEQLDAAIDGLVAAISANSRDALVAGKRLYAAAAELPLSEGLRVEAETGFPIADTEERVASFR
jgi:enoyl-CoA hydratase/carnithine racemase